MNARERNIRLLFFQAIIVISFAALAIPLWHLQVVEGSRYRLRADQNRFRVRSTGAPRGVIYDRLGHPLARNMPRFNITVVPAALHPEDEEQVLNRLVALLNRQADNVPPASGNKAEPYIDIAELRKQIAAGRSAPYQPVVVYKDAPRDIALIAMEAQGDLPGVQVSVRAQRQYVQGKLLAHVLGYVGNIPAEQVTQYVNRPNGDYVPQDIVGLTGVERTFENVLRGRKGQKQSEVDVIGHEIRLVDEVPSQAGHNLVLTIDLDLQRAAEAALRTALSTVRSKSGVVIAMNPQDGQILAMVSWPSYDDNLFVGGLSEDEYNHLTQDTSRPLLNHAVSGVYPPGSTFKIVTAAAALEENVIDRNTLINDPGTIWLPNKFFPDDASLAQPFYCWYKKGHGQLNVVGALAQSCDVFFYEVGGGYREFSGLGVEKLDQYTRLFGFGQRTGIDLPAESPGLVPNKKWKRLSYGESWTTGDTYNMSIGQGAILATPLQVLNATAAVANGGTLYRPQLIYQIQDAEGEVIRGYHPEVLRRLPVSEANLALVREGLRQAVLSGTARHVSIPEASVAGKTGTAEFPGPRDKEGNLPTHAWFTAFAPYENPQIAVVAFVYSGGEGSAVSIPIAREVLQAYFQAHPLSGVPSKGPGHTPSPEAPSPPTPAGTPQPSSPPGAYRGHVVSVQPWEKEISILTVRVLDRNGKGVPGVQVSLDGGGPTVAQFATGPDGKYRYDYFNPKSSPKWNIHLPDMPGDPSLTVSVQSFKHYIVTFQEGE